MVVSLRTLTGLVLVTLVGAIGAPAQTLQWEQIYAQNNYDDPHFRAIGFGVDGTLLAVSTDGVWALPPGPSAWEQRCDRSDPGCRLSVDALTGIGPDTLLVSGSWGLHRSEDGGRSWEEVLDVDSSYGLQTAAVEVKDGTWFAPLSLDGVAYSEDRGSTWQVVPYPPSEPPPITEGTLDFAELAGGRLLAACIGGVAVSDDGGKSWRTSSLWGGGPYPHTATALEVLKNGRVIAISSGMNNQGINVYRSEDGEEWEPRGGILNPGGWLEWPRLFQTSTGALVAVSSGWEGGHIYEMQEEGALWEWVGQGPVPPGFRAASPVLGPDDRLYLLVSSAGPGPVPQRGIYRTLAPVLTVAEPGPVVAGEVKVYPNPAYGPEATIRFTLVEPGEVAVALYDPLGRRVMVIGEGLYGAGEHALSLGVAGLPRGTYLVRVDVEGTAHTRPFTLLR